MNNIKLFDVYSSYIFEKLYKNFPICVDFNPKKEIKIIDEEIIQHTMLIEFDEEQKAKIFGASIMWLERNGFIAIKSAEPNNKNPIRPIIYSNIFCVELTIKGLNLLTSPPPKTLNKTKKLGDEIYEYDYLLVDKQKYIVIFEDGRFVLKDKHNRFMNINKIVNKQVVVTGNYFENTFKEKIEPLLDVFCKLDEKIGELRKDFKNMELPFF